MTATILPDNWLRFMMSEYVDGFVRDGGAAVKFVVPMDEGSRLAPSALTRQADESGYVVAQVDASQTRVHLIHELFFAIAQQVPWQEVADRAISRFAKERGYQVPDSGTGPISQQIVEANHTEPNLFALDLQPLLVDSILKERTLVRDFRVAMTQLCVANLRVGPSEDQRRTAITAWLTGEIRTIGPVRPYQISTPINRTNARYHFQSMLRFLRFVGIPGLIVTIDITSVAEPTNPKDGAYFYSKAMLLDLYESLRQLIDETDRLEGCLIVIVPAVEFLDTAIIGAKQRGLSAYRALQSRIEDEVHDARYANPMVSLVRLSMASTPAPPQTDAGHLRTASPPSATPRDPSPAWNRGITS